ncbi:hypothetical protein DKM44_14350 [Deinococcus irradiatisoli]|uniref:AAA+ ATPase domain-containing protein n=1 Tax=Deinococcus irradiatisoli TaxID=2202254 RepID=A0A2Z3JGZ7_9DEIO|nr:AAA family ATPase [Deinococcus irradiatisoli]AWN24262.1 hypothetical protein DKM44_14350 [Deinococcus irradiatisoli]
MPLTKIDVTQPYQEISWLVPDLIPQGHPTIVAALPGAGKTTVVAALAWVMSSSEEDRMFLDRPVPGGATIYVNYDSPTGDGRSLRYLLAQLQVADPSGRMNLIHILEPDKETYGLGDPELAQIKTLALEQGVKLIVLDAFMTCFPEINANKLSEAMGPLTALRELATETGAAVVIIDHLPKPQAGEKVGARGVMGSIGKSAQARAVHILDLVKPEDADGRHLIRWRVDKMTFGPVPKPFAVECLHQDGGLLLTVGTVDEVLKETRTAKALQLMHRALIEAGEEWTARKDLVELARSEAALGATAAKQALDTLLAKLGSKVEQHTLSKAGGPLVYRLLP